jgi:hypothetical protein
VTYIPSIVRSSDAAAVTVKLLAEVAVPPGVVTEILPVVAPLGTVAVICVAVFTVNVADLPLNFTAVAPVRLVPVIVTEVPTGPLVGVKVVIVGAGTVVTAKSLDEVALPFGVVTEILPVVAPLGTVVVICVPLLTAKVAAVPLNETAVAPLR